MISVVRPNAQPRNVKITDQVAQLIALPMRYTGSGTRAAPQAIGSVSRRP